MPELLTLTSDEKRTLLSVLTERFPWLGTDEDASLVDAVDGLNELYQTLTEEDFGNEEL